MIKLFRNIRKTLLNEGKTSKYIKYAVGEIILVVIGILIALQINNWNENRKIQKAQHGLLIDLRDNLSADSVVVEVNRQLMLEVIHVQKQLHSYRKGEISPDSIKTPQRIRRSIRHFSITKTNHPDVATEVFNENLKNQIRDYYRTLSFIDNAYVQFDNVIKEIVRPYLASQLAMNPDPLFENQDTFRQTNIIDFEHFFKAVSKKEFGQILFEANIKTNEMVEYMNLMLKANVELRNALQEEINKNL